MSICTETVRGYAVIQKHTCHVDYPDLFAPHAQHSVFVRVVMEYAGMEIVVSIWDITEWGDVVTAHAIDRFQTLARFM